MGDGRWNCSNGEWPCQSIKAAREGRSLRRAGTKEKQLKFHMYTRVRPEKDSQSLCGGQFPEDYRSSLCLCLQASQRQVHKDSNTGLEISEVFIYLSCTCNGRKRLYHIFVNDLINENGMRLNAANPNCWLMLKMANSTYFLSSQSH